MEQRLSGKIAIITVPSLNVGGGFEMD